ncbi:hypothetical protein C8A03DRAFT_43975 [Achaetomium macrosporum]|uniref:Berberine/berberine-like domain-containing protein n=1 Tax=Achaetomium macrosporum TaxID=79813 RepID=A0AAN7CC47_9PEZI|nr:hypothetical protein C8A03DRAFT_43975 [Achaetomium macrosporum]
MRAGVFSLLCGVLLLAQGATAQDPVSVAGFRSSRWVLSRDGGSKYACKCYPGDYCWPNNGQWQKLNKTVGGNLQVFLPPGAPCYNTFKGPLGDAQTYNADKCATVTANWNNEQFQIELPAAGLWIYLTNDTCRPATSPSNTCTLGYYPVVVIMAKAAAHIQAGINFAQENNLQLIIRNTGHDFLGRSLGWGARVINTHSFQDTKFTNAWRGASGYKGSAVTVGAGVQAFDVLKQANALQPPKVMVTGECAFKVITADGVLRTANAKTNADLFWALRGGGPAAFGVIVEAMYKTFDDKPSSGVMFDIDTTTTTNATLIHFVDNGLYVYYELGTMGHNLHMHPIVGIGKTPAELDAVLQPMYDDLVAIGITPSVTKQNFSTFYDLYQAMFESEVAGNSALTGGWTIGREDVANNHSAIISAFQTVVSAGSFMIGHMWSAGHGLPQAEWNNSAVNPRFRNVVDKLITIVPVAGNAPLADKAAAQSKLTNVVDAALWNAAPNGCAYINEADPYEPNWQNAFWGNNYPALLEIRRKWDPNGVFYAVSTPGTENWEQTETGTRLCFKL